jgi:poly(3-hydroxybutyrate) depolymerase
MTRRGRAIGIGTVAAWLAAGAIAATLHCGNSSDPGGAASAADNGCQGAQCSSDTSSGGGSGGGAAPGDDGASTSGGDSDAATGKTGGPSDAGASHDATDASAGSAPTAGCGAATWPASGNFTLDVGGTERQYIVTLPSSYASKTPYKLVLAWHGLGGSAAQVAGQGLGAFGASYAYYGLQGMAGDTVIFVAGQGLDPYDAGAGWPNTNDQDIAFTQALVKWLESNYCVDAKHIFSVGMSYGGIMSDTVGCEMGDVVRAIAPMSGSGPYAYFGAKPCVGEVAVWSSHGTQDTTVPFEAGVASRNHWIAENHCTTQTKAVGPGTCVEYQGCDPGYPVDWCEFDGGHTIPSFAAQGIWSFLSRF